MSASEGARSDGPKPATEAVAKLNAAVLDALPFDDTQDFEKTTLEAAVASGTIGIAGDREKVFALFSRLDTFERMFEIVEPRRKTVT